jgi:hypothetical protein
MSLSRIGRPWGRRLNHDENRVSAKTPKKGMTMTVSNKARTGGDGIVRKVLLASVFAAVLALVYVAPPASGQAAPQGTIEAFIGSNLVNVQNYPNDTEVTVKVIRDGIVVGSVTGETVADVEDDPATPNVDESLNTGFVEFNHDGGGQVSEGGDCFEPPSTPDILAGDTIRTVYLDGQTEVVNSAVVRDVGVDFDTISTNANNGTITVSGHAKSLADAPIEAGDVLELRLNKGSADAWDVFSGGDQDREGRTDLRVDIGENLRADGTFTRILNVGQQDARDWRDTPGEVFLEWSEAVPAGEEEEVNPPAIFVADEAGGEAIAGCPPLAQYAVTNSDPAAVNRTFVAGDAPLTVSGVSFGASNVSVTLDDQNSTTPPIVKNATLDTATGAQNWSASFTNAEAESLRDGTLTASAEYTVEGLDINGQSATGTFGGQSLSILKDTVAPTAPRATPRAGTYNRAISVSLSAQAGTDIRYTVNGQNPTRQSRLFTTPIRVSATQTIKAAAFDAAGNRSPIASFRYVIR